MAFVPDTSPMEFVVYIYAPKQTSNMRDFRCPRCSRIVFKTNSNKIFLTDKYGIALKDLPPHSNFIVHRCHSCKASYHILFQ